MSEQINKRRSSIRTIIKPLAIIAVFLGGIFGSYLAISAYLGSETPIVVVTSESMHPVYYEGDILFVKYATPEEIDIGTDIVFHADWIPPTDPNSEIPVVHRVVFKELIGDEWYYTTQGVNEETNPFPDPAATPYSNVIGVVIFIIPRIGLPLIFLKSTIGVWGIQIFLIIIASLLIAYVVYDYYSEDKSKNKVEKDKNPDQGLWAPEDFKETETSEENNRKDENNE